MLLERSRGECVSGLRAPRDINSPGGSGVFGGELSKKFI
jgi:hypothetical protein